MSEIGLIWYLPVNHLFIGFRHSCIKFPSKRRQREQYASSHNAIWYDSLLCSINDVLRIFYFTIFSDCVLLLWGLGDTGRYLLPQWGSTEGRARLRRIPQEGQGTLQEAVHCQGHHAEGQRKGRTLRINYKVFSLGFSTITILPKMMLG